MAFSFYFFFNNGFSSIKSVTVFHYCAISSFSLFYSNALLFYILFMRKKKKKKTSRCASGSLSARYRQRPKKTKKKPTNHFAFAQQCQESRAVQTYDVLRFFPHFFTGPRDDNTEITKTFVSPFFFFFLFFYRTSACCLNNTTTKRAHAKNVKRQNFVHDGVFVEKFPTVYTRVNVFVDEPRPR